MTEKEQLEIEKMSKLDRLKELSEKLNQTTDMVTKNALTENHRNTLLWLEKVNQRLKELN